MPVMLGHLYTSYVLLNAHWSASENLITLFSYDDQAHYYDISVEWTPIDIELCYRRLYASV
jgi:hypothetical protein